MKTRNVRKLQWQRYLHRIDPQHKRLGYYQGARVRRQDRRITGESSYAVVFGNF